MKNFTGVMTALITPFKNDAIDFKSLKNLIKYQMDSKIGGFVVSGSTGEAATLSLEEKTQALKFVMGEVSGQVPVLVGCGTFNTKETCDLIKTFEKLQPSGFLLVTPYYNKPPQRGLEQHFLKAASCTKLPIILYNVPGRTACTISVETVVLLASKASNIVGTKEAAGDLDVIKKLTKDCAKDFLILSGDDPTFLEAISFGAKGVISVVSHIIPKLCVTHAQTVLKNSANVKALSDEIRDISEKIFCESNPIPIKWALKEMGIIETDDVRLPLVSLNPSFQKTLRDSMKKIGAL